MFAVGHTLWIILILYIYSILPLGCKATTVTQEIWMKDDEDSGAMYVLKIGRRLLDSGYNSYDTSSSDTVYYVVFFTVIAIAVLIIKCCIKLMNSQEEEETFRTQHPPPNRLPVQRSAPLPRGSRPLAPPRTSRSIILSPEERQFEPLFIGLQNPAFDFSTSSNPAFDSSTSRNPAFNSSIFRNPAIDSSISRNPTIDSSRSSNPAFDFTTSSNLAFDFSMSSITAFNFSTSTGQVQSNSNLTSLLDLPPDYESAVKEDAEKYAENNYKEAEDDPPPKYDFT